MTRTNLYAGITAILMVAALTWLFVHQASRGGPAPTTACTLNEATMTTTVPGHERQWCIPLDHLIEYDIRVAGDNIIYMDRDRRN
jgi:hypothetical protein